VNARKLLDAAMSFDTSSNAGAGVATGRKLRDASVSDSTAGVSGRKLLDESVGGTTAGVSG